MGWRERQGRRQLQMAQVAEAETVVMPLVQTVSCMKKIRSLRPQVRCTAPRRWTLHTFIDFQRDSSSIRGFVSLVLANHVVCVLTVVSWIRCNGLCRLSGRLL